MRDKRFNRQPSGPGRSTKRARTAPASAATPPDTPIVEAPQPPPSRFAALRVPRLKPRRPRLTVTRRALVFFAVIAVLGLSFAGSLRVWLVQSNELATARVQIEERRARVAELESELERWKDSSYVRAQARTRLGWVMPGDVGYRVLDENGQVLSGTAEIEGVGAAHGNGLEARWWDRLATSLHHADDPPLPTP